jgi:inorganic pyrophosphatase
VTELASLVFRHITPSKRSTSCRRGRTHISCFATQDNKDKERNDRIIAVEKDAHSWADIRTIDDLGKEFCQELEEFFVNYHKLSGKQYRVLGLKGPEQARKLVKSGMR